MNEHEKSQNQRISKLFKAYKYDVQRLDRIELKLDKEFGVRMELFETKLADLSLRQECDRRAIMKLIKNFKVTNWLKTIAILIALGIAFGILPRTWSLVLNIFGAF